MILFLFMSSYPLQMNKRDWMHKVRTYFLRLMTKVRTFCLFFLKTNSTPMLNKYKTEISTENIGNFGNIVYLSSPSRTLMCIMMLQSCPLTLHLSYREAVIESSHVPVFAVSYTSIVINLIQTSSTSHSWTDP